MIPVAIEAISSVTKVISGVRSGCQMKLKRCQWRQKMISVATKEMSGTIRAISVAAQVIQGATNRC